MSDFAKSLRDGPTPTKKPPTSARRERDASSSTYTDMDPPMSARKLSYKSSQPTSASKTAATKTTPRRSGQDTQQSYGGDQNNHAPPAYAASPRDSEDGGQMNLDDALMDGVEGESVQVMVRIRPHNEKELQYGDETSCLQLLGTRAITCSVPGREPRTFTYDNILQGEQTEVFQVAGLPMVDNCMSGYNSSIFAYGQTGAGKTHTMLGQIDRSKNTSGRGLAPRVFDYLFQKIGEEEDREGRDSLRYSCRCSFLEIYNETITDLLNPAATNLQIREDTHGCFVEYLTETEVLNVDDVLTLMRHGSENRHTGETRLNRESSRSHSVFTCTVEKTSKAKNGVTSVICSRLNLIDLAGSERVHGGALGGSHAVGTHFKEAVHINKSLTTLGRVIMELVEAQRSGRAGRHIPYRDSRLTFLLQDSLGGNAKTQIIANVSPSAVCSAETLSTLYFVQRAKCIRNRATINLDYRGDAKLLQNEILRLNTEISNLKSGITEPAIQENTDLRIKLDKEERRAKELELKIISLVADNNQFKRERERLEEHLTSTQAIAAERGNLEGEVAALKAELEACKATIAELQAQAEESKVTKAALEEQISELQGQVTKLEAAHAAELKQQQETAAAELQALQERLTCEEQAHTSSTQEVVQLQEQLEEVEAVKDAAAEMAEDQKQHIGKLKQDLDTLEQESSKTAAELQSSLEASQAEAAALKQQLEESVQVSAQLTTELLASQDTGAQLSQQLQGSQAEVTELKGSVQSGQQTVAELEKTVQAGNEAAAGLEQQLQGSQAEVVELKAQVEAGQAAAAEAEQQMKAQIAAGEAVIAEKEQQLQGSQAEVVELKAQVEAGESAAVEKEELLQASQSNGSSLNEQLQASQADSARLTQELASSQQAVAMLTEELQAAVAKLGKEKGDLGEDLARSQASAAALTSELQSSQGEASRLTEERAQLSQELGATKSQLEAVQAQSQSLTLQVATLERTAQETEVATHVSAKEQQTQIATLQKEIIREQEKYAVRVFDLEGTNKGLEEELDALRQDKAQATTLLESKDEQLAQNGKALAEQASALEAAQANIAAREKELHELQASTKEAMTKTQQLHESNQAYILELQRELNSFKLGRGDMEQQMKNFLVTNTRQGRAFTEIRRLIEWATTPPSSARATLGARNENGVAMIESAGGMSPAGTPTGKTAAADLAAASARSPTKVSKLKLASSNNDAPKADQQQPDVCSDEGDDVERIVMVHAGPKPTTKAKRADVGYSDVDSPLAARSNRDQTLHAQ